MKKVTPLEKSNQTYNLPFKDIVDLKKSYAEFMSEYKKIRDTHISNLSENKIPFDVSQNGKISINLKFIPNGINLKYILDKNENEIISLLKKHKIQFPKSIYEAKIALLKAELLVQKEIADNNHKGFESVRNDLVLLNSRYAMLDTQNSKSYSDYVSMEANFRIAKKVADNAIKERIELTEAVREVKSKLSKIPKWIQWIFC